MDEPISTIGMNLGMVACIPAFCVLLTMALIGVEPVANWPWWAVAAPFWGLLVLKLVLGIADDLIGWLVNG